MWIFGVVKRSRRQTFDFEDVSPSLAESDRVANLLHTYFGAYEYTSFCFVFVFFCLILRKNQLLVSIIVLVSTATVPIFFFGLDLAGLFVPGTLIPRSRYFICFPPLFIWD